MFFLNKKHLNENWGEATEMVNYPYGPLFVIVEELTLEKYPKKSSYYGYDGHIIFSLPNEIMANGFPLKTFQRKRS